MRTMPGKQRTQVANERGEQLAGIVFGAGEEEALSPRVDLCLANGTSNNYNTNTEQNVKR